MTFGMFFNLTGHHFLKINNILILVSMYFFLMSSSFGDYTFNSATIYIFIMLGLGFAWRFVFYNKWNIIWNAGVIFYVLMFLNIALSNLGLYLPLPFN